ncbi:hypothetical protein POM88_007778 [Heracleum sosnowskyi]|uniref:RING-type domain-containing protein n=1 Tax=Heracleum sosnowskyi TaxID=360622 RepID=A0AAD8J8R0_9APIA|nr:hypothetical protein POM88_007778 [Heracleum sosnowskyi]
MQMQEDSDKKMVNPWILHLHNLSLALKCPLCKKFLNRPILLPCHHLFCDECISMSKVTQNASICPACKTHYVHHDKRPALFIENMIAVFKSLCMTSFADTYNPLASDVKDVVRLSEQSPVSAITNHGMIEEPVETSAEENSVERKSIRFLHRSKSNAQIGSRGDLCGREGDMSTQSQRPDQLTNGNLVNIAIKTINMNRMKWLSVGRTRSLRDIYKDAKRRNISNSSEAYDDKCGFGHTFNENGQILHYANRELVPGDQASSKVTNIHNVVTDWTSGVSYEDKMI